MRSRSGAQSDAPATTTAVPTPLPNSYWVVPGRFLAGEYPGGRAPEPTGARLERLLAAGIDFFLDLTAPGERPPYDRELPPHVKYVRHAIEDHGTPQDPAEMTAILATLADALRQKRRVYLHCRAGIGRTGTTVACYLVSQDLPPEEALAELNRLWQACERSASWPEVPETPEQRAFVEGWPPRAPIAHAAAAAPIPPPLDDGLGFDGATLSAAKRLRERFHGALLGLAVGDALAAATQFRRPGSFHPVGDLLGGGPFDLPRGAWSDDTAMPLCLAESLLECHGFDARDQIRRYLMWQQQGHLSATAQCVGITASVTKALATAQWRPHVLGASHDPKQLDKECLVRVAPVAMFFFASAAQAIDNAGQAARTTCQAPLVLETCRLFGAMLHGALSGRTKSELLAPPPAAWSRRPRLSPRLAALVAGAYRASEPPRIRGDGQIVSALEAALWAFARTTNFRAGALAAVNLGGDSDVIAAVYGQLAGAFYGVTGIPQTWRDSLLRKDLLEEFADRLLAEALVALGEA
jgi:ADP-ribosyl-[dinitrogen reductase] hydrolase